MDNAIQNGVGECRLADDVMPRFHGQQAGDRGRAAGRVSILDDLHQITTLRGGDPVRSPIVEDQRLSFRYAAEQAREAPVVTGQFQYGGSAETKAPEK